MTSEELLVDPSVNAYTTTDNSNKVLSIPKNCVYEIVQFIGKPNH